MCPALGCSPDPSMKRLAQARIRRKARDRLEERGGPLRRRPISQNLDNFRVRQYHIRIALQRFAIAGAKSLPHLRRSQQSMRLVEKCTGIFFSQEFPLV